ncbi:MAG: hypothetical protein WCO69_00405 [Candidatus Omnitrophota bacterium]
MKHHEDGIEKAWEKCTGSGTRNVWLAGAAVTVLFVLFCTALFKGGNVPLPGQSVGRGNGAQQAAFIPPACATCPTVTQCFPNATTNPAQPAAFIPPGCATCPTVTNCFPNATPPAQPVAFGQGRQMGTFTCPQCKFTFNDVNCWNRGYTRCPRCGQMIPVAPKANNGFQQIALNQGVTPPPIFRDANMLHEFRGVCENCHVVRPDITIPANTTQMPHVYRGVCSNCHQINGLKPAAI